MVPFVSCALDAGLVELLKGSYRIYHIVVRRFLVCGFFL